MILAAFPDETAMHEAARRLAPLGTVDTHSPAPPQPGAATSPLPLIILAAGLVGAALSFGIQAYAAAWSYPINVGGRPLVFWPAFIPGAFEGGVLSAVLAGFLGFFLLARMPRLYAPIDESDAFRRASRDLWFVAIRVPNPESLDAAREALHACHPLLTDEVPG